MSKLFRGKKAKIFKGKIVGMIMMKIFGIFVVMLLSFSFASAVVLNSADSSDIFPGETSVINIEIENVFNDDVIDLTIALDLSNLPFTPVGSSEDSIDELEEDDDEDFIFRLKSANDIVPGDYQIPYTISFERDGVDKVRRGTIGVRVVSKTELSFSVDSENNIVGEKGKISLKIVNSGFGDIRFVSVRIFPDKYTLLSDNVDYIGTIDSDDFETATFDVIFNGDDVKLVALVEYKDFDNKKVLENVNLPVIVYSRQEAIELGIIKKSNGPVIVSVIITLVLLWILWRTFKKRSRIKRSVGKKE